MNAERLHAIALAILEDFNNTNVDNVFQHLIDSLQNQVNDPQNPDYQQQVSQHLTNLNDILSRAASNEFSPAWKQAINELGAEGLLGNDLRAPIKEIFERNQITPSVALEELRDMHSRILSFKSSLEQAVSGLEQLHIGAEELNPGECELGILVPRKAVDNRVSDFGDELKELDGIFSTFAELAIGTRPGFEIRSISTTDFSVFLDILPAVGACIAIAVERTVSLYKQLLEIRKIRRDLKDQGVPAEKTTGIEEHADSLMEKGIETLVQDLLDRYWKKDDDGRRNEMATALRFALRKIATRIDNGYNVEIRVKPLSEEDTSEEGESQSEDGKHITTILSVAKALEFLKLEGDPILSLPESQQKKEGKK